MVLHALQNLRDGLLSLAYPQDCRLCSSSVESWNNGIVCPACWHNPQITKLFSNRDCCVKCGLPLSRPQQFPVPDQFDSAYPSLDSSEALPARHCGRCNELPFTFARACGEYAGALEANVLFLKSRPHLCRRLRDILAQTYQANKTFLASDVVIPVPLHDARKRERGFNQAELIARTLAADCHLTLDTTALIRAKHTERHRLGMDEVDRAKSMEKAFAVTTPRRLASKSVLLIDDVFTTGSTIGAAVKKLLQAAVTQVKVLTLVRVIRR